MSLVDSGYYRLFSMPRMFSFPGEDRVYLNHDDYDELMFFLEDSDYDHESDFIEEQHLEHLGLTADEKKDAEETTGNSYVQYL